MKKIKRMLAGLAAILLILMYVASLIFALINHPSADKLLMASVISTIVIPVLMYGYILVYKITRNNNDSDE